MNALKQHSAHSFYWEFVNRVETETTLCCLNGSAFVCHVQKGSLFILTNTKKEEKQKKTTTNEKRNIFMEITERHVRRSVYHIRNCVFIFFLFFFYLFKMKMIIHWITGSWTKLFFVERTNKMEKKFWTIVMKQWMMSGQSGRVSRTPRTIRNYSMWPISVHHFGYTNWIINHCQFGITINEY